MANDQSYECILSDGQTNIRKDYFFVQDIVEFKSYHSNFELLTRNKAADFTDVLVFNLKCKGIEIFDNFVIA